MASKSGAPPGVCSDQSAEVLKRRLASAEQDTQQLMLQLEEMGFNTKNECERYSEPADGQKLKTTTHNKEINDAQTVKYKISQPVGAPSGHSKPDKNNYERHSNSKSAKHKPITPLSLKGILPGPFDEGETKSYEQFIMKQPQTKPSDCANKNRHRGDSGDGKVLFIFPILFDCFVSCIKVVYLSKVLLNNLCNKT